MFRLKQYRQYLLRRRFIVRSDHAALTYLHSFKELIGQQARWLDSMKKFNFDLQDRAGTMHGNVDALSRKYSFTTMPSLPPCSQCITRGMVSKGPYRVMDACQDGDHHIRVPSSGPDFTGSPQTRPSSLERGRYADTFFKTTADPSTSFANSVTTRAQRRRLANSPAGSSVPPVAHCGRARTPR